tara:strand:+ start:783 stop:1667 length:885 start_codon:yes stop_codon:yes gene_type:complete
MRKITLILPVYNDWESLRLLLGKIEKKVKKKEHSFQVLLINDSSTILNKKKLNQNKLFKNIRSINLKSNIGSQKAIAIGLKFISNNLQKFGKDFIIMDSDGEDDYSKINKILHITKKNKEINVVTVNRSTRKESLVFSILYEIHLIITFVLTFKYIRFGNYSYLSDKALKSISKKNELWLAYSASLEKYFKNKKIIIAERKKRFMGKSKMNYWQLLIHSIKIHSVFLKRIFFNYILYSLLIIFIAKIKVINFVSPLFFTLMFIHILLLIYVNYFSSNTKFYNSLKNIKSIDLIK